MKAWKEEGGEYSSVTHKTLITDLASECNIRACNLCAISNRINFDHNSSLTRSPHSSSQENMKLQAQRVGSRKG